METTYLERLETEQAELQMKLEKLAKMLSAAADYNIIISDEEQKLMRHQYVTMQEYNQVLVQRLKLNQPNASLV